MCMCVCVCVCMHSDMCRSRHDLSRISRQRGWGQSSQKPGVARSCQRSWKVRVLSEYQRAPWEPGMAKQSQIGFQGLTGQRIATTHTLHTPNLQAGVGGVYKG